MPAVAMMKRGAEPVPLLAATQLSCLRGDELVFEQLSLAAHAGEIWQIVGPNGAGKTSLLKILAGLASAAGGKLEWRGEQVVPGCEALRRELCYLGHLPGVTGFLSVAENLQFMADLAAQAPARSASEALVEVGLGDLLEAPARRLSAGQRQRLGLARFLMLATPLWILDEPLTALDAAGRELVDRMLSRHAAHGGIAIVSTHHALGVPADCLRRFEFEAARHG